MNEIVNEPTVEIPLTEHIQHVIEDTTQLEQEAQDQAIRDTQSQVEANQEDTQETLATLQSEIAECKSQLSGLSSMIQEMKQTMEKAQEQVQEVKETVTTPVAEPEVSNDVADHQEVETKTVEADMQPIKPPEEAKRKTGFLFRHPTRA